VLEKGIGGNMAATQAIREQSYYVLAALMSGPQHGYGIIKETVRVTDGDVRLAPGTLYGALDRLSDAGLIENDREEVVEGRVRRYVRLTRRGRRLVVAEAERMESAARLVLDHGADGSLDRTANYAIATG
jgi:DNA-binding PadR family transcriptional regulator